MQPGSLRLSRVIWRFELGGSTDGLRGLSSRGEPNPLSPGIAGGGSMIGGRKGTGSNLMKSPCFSADVVGLSSTLPPDGNTGCSGDASGGKIGEISLDAVARLLLAVEWMEDGVSVNAGLGIGSTAETEADLASLVGRACGLSRRL